MRKAPSPIAIAKAGDRVRVLDAKTGEAISHVVDADAGRGTLTRFAVEDGNLVREGDAFMTIREERDIRIEPLDAQTVDPLAISNAREGAA